MTMTKAVRGGLGIALTLALGAGCGGTSTTEREDPGVISLSGTLGNDFVTAGADGEVLARIRISTEPIDGTGRPPLNLAVVIDTSGSMAGEPIEDAREAALTLVDLLREGDRLSVVAFHSTSEVLLPSTVIEDNLDELRTRIAEMEARGTTDMAGGFRAGVSELMNHYDADGVNRLVLLGDGVPNEESGIVAMAQAAGERGMSVTAIGLGLDYNETLMGDVARASGGRFHYVEDSEQVAALFHDEVMRMQRVFGRNAVVRLQPGPGVTIQNVVGQNVQHVGGFVEVHLGDLHEGEHRDLIVRATALGRRAGATVELMDVHLGFDDAVAEAGHLERRVFLGATASEDDEEVAQGRDRELESEAARMQAAAATVQALRLNRDGDVIQARAILEQAEEEAQAHVQGDDPEMAAQVSSINALRNSMPLPSAATGHEPEPEAAENRQAIQRRVHDDAMGALGF